MSQDRLPPHDMDAEQAVLGCMMLSPDGLAVGLEKLTADAFFRPAHQILFETMSRMSARMDPVDALTVNAELQTTGQLSKVGGATYLHTLLAAPPTVANCDHYAAIVADHAGARAVLEVVRQIEDQAWKPGMTRDERIEAAYQFLESAADTTGATSRARSVAELLISALDAISSRQNSDETPGLPTPWKDLNALLGGLRNGQLITVAARPSVGKSLVALNVAAHVGITLRKPVYMAALEMSHGDTMERLIADHAGVNLSGITNGGLTDTDWKRIGEHQDKFSLSDMFVINDDTELTMHGIRADLDRMRRAGRPAELVVVDYLGLITSTQRAENRQLEVSEFSRGLKKLAKRYEVPVVAAAQLNRGPEQRSDRRPVLADLRESGSIEQDSDVVILLFREDAYDQESPRAGEIDLIVAKNRQGPQATVTLAFQGHYARISDMAADDVPSETPPVHPQRRLHSVDEGDWTPSDHDSGSDDDSGEATA